LDVGEDWVLRATLNRRVLLPSGRRQLDDLAARARTTAGTIERLTLIGARQLGRHALFLVVNLLVAGVVMALPFIAGASSHPSAQLSVFSASTGSTTPAPVDGEPQLARVAPQARGGTIVAGRNPMTFQSEGVRPIPQYTLSTDDTLWTIANFFKVTPEAIAFANGITDPYHLQAGRQIMIPPLQGALYTVAEGDTIDSVAERFKVDPTVIKDYNRLYFEPQHFGVGQLIFVENAALPNLPAAPEPVATVIARPVVTAPTARADGYLAWPVAGYLTQRYWAGHLGVDIAAPYGTGLAASINGAITQNGWVAVGGLHICVRGGNLEECYYHLSAAYVPVGTTVTKGQIVAAIGLTGVTTGPHVHWETRLDGKIVDPLSVQP
jgi:murein DD-endopeptidase MepM/ murein hydrolase activator NlpD